MGFFSKDRIVAAPGFNRWKGPPASVAIHLCIGSVYAWSIFNPALMRVRGVAAPAAGDWNLKEVVWIFTVAIVFLGLSAAVAGKWLERVGPRVVGSVSALCWGGGFLLGALGIHLHQLWLLYLGYGVIGGCGLGLGYVSPVSTLMRWFPDRRGMAAGMAIMGFGGGAMIATPLKENLIRYFYEPPVYLGKTGEVNLSTRDGIRYASYHETEREVVVVSAQETKAMIVPGPEGVYLVDTGRAGVAETFLVLGLGYFVIMMLASVSYRIPGPGWLPAGYTPPVQGSGGKKMMVHGYVDVNEALKTPQFYLLWIVLCFNVTAGIGVLGVARTMMTEIFGAGLPAIVDSEFAALYVVMTSVFNMVGRFFWASVSDYLGRKKTYAIFFGLGTLLYLSIPYTAWQFSVAPAVAWLVYFYAATMLIFTMYGGGFATIPAYLADLFGTRYVGGIHGRLLTAWSTAGVVGPLATTMLREHSLRQAIVSLSDKVSPTVFLETFGAGLDQLDRLVTSQTVTLPKLMELMPPGTSNPSSTLYNSTMILMAGLLVVAFLANALVRPVAARHVTNE
jgi:MFS family permease